MAWVGQRRAPRPAQAPRGNPLHAAPARQGGGAAAQYRCDGQQNGRGQRGRGSGAPVDIGGVGFEPKARVAAAAGAGAGDDIADGDVGSRQASDVGSSG